MGRNDKHKSGQSRNSTVFKIVGGKAGKAKPGKPKGVDLKLKKLKPSAKKTSSVESVANLDAKYANLQQRQVSFNGSIKENTKAAAAVGSASAKKGET